MKTTFTPHYNNDLAKLMTIFSKRWHKCKNTISGKCMDQYNKQLSVECLLVVRPLAGQLLHTHCRGPPILGGLVAGG